MNARPRQRYARGEANGMAKLTDERVRIILAGARAGFTERQLAREHGVHHSTVHRVVAREYWAHVEAPLPDAAA